MRSTPFAACFIACLILAGCAQPLKPSSEVVLQTQPRPRLEQLKTEPPPSGTYSQRATSFWLKVESWRERSRSTLKGTPAQ